MNRQTFHTRQFFDSIAPGYAKRYTSGNAYHRYFFNERLVAATSHLDVASKTILDIGAGTGALYDYLKNNRSEFDYFACDIAPKMLENSNIPVDQRFTGRVWEIDFPVQYFDTIYLLGVSTYMEDSELKSTLLFIQQRLKENGMAVISFTHRCSLDHRIRSMLKSALQFFNFLPFARKKVIGQKFPIKAYCKKDLAGILPPLLTIQELQWLNQTVSPFNHLLPGPSVRFARFLQKSFSPSGLLPLLSADFLIRISRQ